MPGGTTFAYSAYVVDDLEKKLAEEKGFECADDWELTYVTEQDDTGEDRLIYGFGQSCPLELANGVVVCRSFKNKFNCCQSVVSESLARNYLAKHAFDSSNHPTQGDSKAAFEAARAARVEDGIETKEDRKSFRAHCDYFMNLKLHAQASERDRERGSERDCERGRASNDVDRNQNRSQARSRSRGGSSVTPPAKSKSSAPLANTAGAIANDSSILPHRAPGYAKVDLADLKTLEGCLGRAIDSQKRTIDSLNFFSRMIEDERKVFTEAKNVITDLVFKASR